MKKTIIYFLGIAITTLLCCSCEDNSSGKYPYDTIRFYVDNNVPIKHPTQVIKATSWGDWNAELYPMEVWIEETDIATVDNRGYVTGHKIGTFTLHAKVMGKHGLMEDSKQFTVSDALTFFTFDQILTLQGFGIDKNNDYIITAPEMEQTEVLEGMIHSDFLLEIGKYLPNLKEVGVVADTSSRSLDLSMFKLRKLTITDACWWSTGEDRDYDRLKPFFLTELKLNNSIEHIVVKAMPGFPVMDLSEYTNLKTIERHSSRSPQWYDMTFVLPLNIEFLNLSCASINFKQIYNKLHTIELTYCLSTIITKENVPNLKKISYNPDIWSGFDASHYNRVLDISSYEASDLYEVNIDWIDTLYVSQSVKDKFYVSANNVIIK